MSVLFRNTNFTMATVAATALTLLVNVDIVGDYILAIRNGMFYIVPRKPINLFYLMIHLICKTKFLEVAQDTRCSLNDVTAGLCFLSTIAITAISRLK